MGRQFIIRGIALATGRIVEETLSADSAAAAKARAEAGGLQYVIVRPVGESPATPSKPSEERDAGGALPPRQP